MKADSMTKWLMALLGSGLWAVAVTHGVGKPSVPNVVRARRFEAVDANGEVRARLGPTPQGCGLLILDEKSKARVILGTVTAPDISRSILILSDKNADAKVRLLADQDGHGLALVGKDGQNRVWLGLSEDSPSLAFVGKDGRAIDQAPE